ncbi:unnamed protein product, partial [Polarella glacialis]
VMVLPCTWSVFPTTEWQPNWNAPDAWIAEVVERRRYPGIISTGHVQVFCPDEMDLLAAWAYLPISTTEESRQSRIRTYSAYEGRKQTRYCTRRTVGESCCRCGEKVSIFHVAGDMKNWPAMQGLLRAYLPPWKDPPSGDVFVRSASRIWTGGPQRMEQVFAQTEMEALVVAKQLGYFAVFSRCVTFVTKQDDFTVITNYHQAQLKEVSIPLLLEIETTAKRDASVRIGPSLLAGIEI